MSDVLATNAELEALRKAAGIPHLPTQLTFEARLAIGGEGPRAYDWSDKPHRLVFDLCREIEMYAAIPAVQPGHVNETPKSEHDARDVLTPATKEGA